MLSSVSLVNSWSPQAMSVSMYRITSARW